MDLEDRPLLRRVVLVEPPDDLHVRPLLQSEQAVLVFLVQDDQRAVVGLLDVADGVDLELGGRGLLGVFCCHDVAERDSGGQDEGDGEADHGWLQLADCDWDGSQGALYSDRPSKTTWTSEPSRHRSCPR